MSWEIIELLLKVSFSLSVVFGNLRRPHPAIVRAENEGSFYIAAFYLAVQWGGVIAMLASLWFASPHLRDGIWTCVVFFWIASNSLYRGQEQPQPDSLNAT